MILFLNLYYVCVYSITSDPPPSGTERGMYVDCANDIIYELRAGNTTKRDELYAFMLDRHITYVALFSLDTGSPSIIEDPALQDVLSDFIDFLKTNIPGLEVGMVISSNSDNDPYKIELYDYGRPNFRCVPYGGNEHERITNIFNPSPDSDEDTKKLALMARAALHVKCYNDGAGEESINIRFNQAHFPGPHSGKIDWISVEREYWHISDADPVSGTQSFPKAYQNYIDLLWACKIVCCQTNYQLKLETELSIIDYPKCIPVDPFWPNADVLGFPSGQAQADEIDLLVDRILMVDYFRFVQTIFDRQCHNFYFMGNSTTNPYRRSRIWPLFSVEFPEIGQVRCNGNATGCSEAFLGYFLLPPAQPPLTLVCDPLISVSSSGGDFQDVEKSWLDQMSIATSCFRCSGTSYNTNFTTNIADNTYDGFMWFVYSIMNDMSYHKLGRTERIAQKSYFVYPNPGNGIYKIKASDDNIINAIHISDAFGNIIELIRPVGANQEYEINLSNHSSGIYFVQVQNTFGTTENYKVILQK